MTELIEALRPTMSTYLNRRSGNPDPQAKRVDIGPITLWFSYTTVIAFRVAGKPRVVRRNAWGPTTGRHLNAIDRDQAGRVDEATFNLLMAEQIGRFFWPRDLDKDCPPGIVADWLEDRGLESAARVVRENDG